MVCIVLVRTTVSQEIEDGVYCRTVSQEIEMSPRLIGDDGWTRFGAVGVDNGWIGFEVERVINVVCPA